MRFSMKLAAILLVTSSLCLVSANVSLASHDPLQEEQERAPHVTQKFTKDDLPRLYKMGLENVLREESRKDISADPSVAGYKMSMYPPLATEEGFIFREFYMLGDGSCAKYGMGTTPEEAQRLLLAKGIAKEDPFPCDEDGTPVALSEAEMQERARAFAERQGEALRTRQYAHLEIVDLYRDNPQALPRAILRSERLRQLERDLEDKGDYEQEELIAQWAMEEDTFKDYVTHAFGAGVFTRYEQDFGGEMPLRPYMIDALAYAMGMNLSIWQQVVDFQNVHDRPALDQEQGTFVRVHNFTVEDTWPTAHLVHRGGQFMEGREAVDAGDHFNRLVSTDDAAGLVQAAEDEKRHLSNLAGSLWAHQLLEQYRKAAFDVLYGFQKADEPLPTLLKLQAWMYCKDLVETFTVLDPSPLSAHEKALTRVVMARAYALAVDKLEKKAILTFQEKTKLNEYRQKRESLRRTGLVLESFSEEDIALMTVHLHQGSLYESGFHRGYASKATVERTIALEFHDVLKGLYDHEKKMILDHDLFLGGEEDVLAAQASYFKKLLSTPYFFPEDPVPEDFDVDDYLKLNPDVQEHATKTGLKRETFGVEHYKKFGRNEQRLYKIIPGDFDGAEYLAMNEDLVTHCLSQQGKSLKDTLAFARHHFRERGCLSEKRAYKFIPQRVSYPEESKQLPADFKPMAYLCVNRDVLEHYLEKNFSLQEAINGAYWHCTNHALKEYRSYK